MADAMADIAAGRTWRAVATSGGGAPWTAADIASLRFQLQVLQPERGHVGDVYDNPRGSYSQHCPPSSGPPLLAQQQEHLLLAPVRSAHSLSIPRASRAGAAAVNNAAGSMGDKAETTSAPVRRVSSQTGATPGRGPRQGGGSAWERSSAAVGAPRSGEVAFCPSERPSELLVDVLTGGGGGRVAMRGGSATNSTASIVQAVAVEDEPAGSTPAAAGLSTRRSAGPAENFGSCTWAPAAAATAAAMPGSSSAGATVQVGSRGSNSGATGVAAAGRPGPLLDVRTFLRQAEKEYAGAAAAVAAPSATGTPAGAGGAGASTAVVAAMKSGNAAAELRARGPTPSQVQQLQKQQQVAETPPPPSAPPPPQQPKRTCRLVASNIRSSRSANYSTVAFDQQQQQQQQQDRTPQPQQQQHDVDGLSWDRAVHNDVGVTSAAEAASERERQEREMFAAERRLLAGATACDVTSSPGLEQPQRLAQDAAAAEQQHNYHANGAPDDKDDMPSGEPQSALPQALPQLPQLRREELPLAAAPGRASPPGLAPGAAPTATVCVMLQPTSMLPSSPPHSSLHGGSEAGGGGGPIALAAAAAAGPAASRGSAAAASAGSGAAAAVAASALAAAVVAALPAVEYECDKLSYASWVNNRPAAGTNTPAAGAANALLGNLGSLETSVAGLANSSSGEVLTAESVALLANCAAARRSAAERVSTSPNNGRAAAAGGGLGGSAAAAGGSQQQQAGAVVAAGAEGSRAIGWNPGQPNRGSRGAGEQLEWEEVASHQRRGTKQPAAASAMGRSRGEASPAAAAAGDTAVTDTVASAAAAAFAQQAPAAAVGCSNSGSRARRTSLLSAAFAATNGGGSSIAAAVGPSSCIVQGGSIGGGGRSSSSMQPMCTAGSMGPEGSCYSAGGSVVEPSFNMNLTPANNRPATANGAACGGAGRAASLTVSSALALVTSANLPDSTAPLSASTRSGRHYSGDVDASTALPAAVAAAVASGAPLSSMRLPPSPHIHLLLAEAAHAGAGLEVPSSSSGRVHKAAASTLLSRSTSGVGVANSGVLITPYASGGGAAAVGAAVAGGLSGSRPAVGWMAPAGSDLAYADPAALAAAQQQQHLQLLQRLQQQQQQHAQQQQQLQQLQRQQHQEALMQGLSTSAFGAALRGARMSTRSSAGFLTSGAAGGAVTSNAARGGADPVPARAGASARDHDFGMGGSIARRQSTCIGVGASAYQQQQQQPGTLYTTAASGSGRTRSVENLMILSNASDDYSMESAVAAANARSKPLPPPQPGSRTVHFPMSRARVGSGLCADAPVLPCAPLSIRSGESQPAANGSILHRSSDSEAADPARTRATARGPAGALSPVSEGVGRGFHSTSDAAGAASPRSRSKNFLAKSLARLTSLAKVGGGASGGAGLSSTSTGMAGDVGAGSSLQQPRVSHRSRQTALSDGQVMLSSGLLTNETSADESTEAARLFTSCSNSGGAATVGRVTGEGMVVVAAAAAAGLEPAGRHASVSWGGHMTRVDSGAGAVSGPVSAAADLATLQPQLLRTFTPPSRHQHGSGSAPLAHVSAAAAAWPPSTGNNGSSLGGAGGCGGGGRTSPLPLHLGSQQSPPPMAPSAAGLAVPRIVQLTMRSMARAGAAGIAGGTSALAGARWAANGGGGNSANYASAPLGSLAAAALLDSIAPEGGEEAAVAALAAADISIRGGGIHGCVGGSQQPAADPSSGFGSSLQGRGSTSAALPSPTAGVLATSGTLQATQHQPSGKGTLRMTTADDRSSPTFAQHQRPVLLLLPQADSASSRSCSPQKATALGTSSWQQERSGGGAHRTGGTTHSFVIAPAVVADASSAAAVVGRGGNNAAGAMDAAQAVGSAGGGGGGGAESGSWYEVTVSAVPHPTSPGEFFIMVVQHDVSARMWAERQLARVVEAEHALLEAIFPAHVLEHIAVATMESAITAGGGAGAGAAPTAPAATQQGPGTAVAGTTDSAAAAVSGPLHITGDTFIHLATNHSMITVLFCDIQGFTGMCNSVRPGVVMAFLNDLFTRLDALLDAFGVYKVETIGDCYMVAGGLMKVDEETGAVTVRSDDVDPLHAYRTVQFAKALLQAASDVRLPTSGQPVKLRVGIHSGSAMSGVVGTRMPRFCLFGDTVNTASRMESTGEAGAIHVSKAVFDLVPGEAWEPTGGVQAKGKGQLETYLLRPDTEENVDAGATAPGF
ncbi:hypothetical protein HXX76_006881 [Chlamydomonas incerta]|uniref:Guanylate cyclase domain-containing protein n=1 Tax=Chlamydomonas incerta TaxID=51695 RepID=A0A835TCH9_CHLIN|nr:hypothetical protein HXX76_006881 [Chlamydomonas incerta]|eukprot:KAG2435681.1 hypothetical protein HXX76_006881 [Chlamydomonas incerta]